MNKIIAIARWEYLDKVRKKSFWIGIFLTPLIWVLLGVVPSMLINKEDEHAITIGIVDMTDSLTAPLQSYLDGKFHLKNGTPNYHLLALPVETRQLTADTVRARADSLVANALTESYLFIPPSLGQVNASRKADSVEFRGTAVSNMKLNERLEAAVHRVMLDRRLINNGVDVARFHEAEHDVEFTTIEVSKAGGSHEKGFISTFAMSYVFIILLMMMTLMSGGMLVRSMVEEKSTRIIEVLFSSAAPRQILAGKVLGLSAVGMTQLAVLIALGLIALTQVPFDYSALADVPLMLVYFVLGYTLYTAVFVGIGSIVTTEQEAQQVTAYMSILLVVPFTFIFSSMQNPNDMLVRVLSQIPFLSPSFMLMRIPIHHPAWWEILLSLTTLILTIAGIIMLSGKIFRIAMLMYGKRPTLKELFRLAKT